MNYSYFKHAGKSYTINKPNTPDSWYNYLYNDTYYMEVSQTLQGKSQYLRPTITNHIDRGYRFFYLLDHDSKECWSPNYRGEKKRLDYFECVHSLGYTKLQSKYKGIKSSIRVFVPLAGQYEIWAAKISNSSKYSREISLFTVFPFNNYSTAMENECHYNKELNTLISYTFPYHVFYEEKEEVENDNPYSYMMSDILVESYDCSQRRFFGGDDITELPSSVKRGHCTNLSSQAELPVGACQHRFILEPGEEKTVNIVVGTSSDIESIIEIKNKLFKPGYIQEEFQKVEKYWEDMGQMINIKTPDSNLNYFINYWLKKQIIMQTRTKRRSFYCPIRNELQDAMGYSMLDVEGAIRYMMDVLERQETSGYIKQWNMLNGDSPRGMCLLQYNDGPAWLVICFCVLLNQYGNMELLDRLVGFKDSIEKATIYEHLIRAIEYLANDTGMHGLCLMRDGDWTDPINGPGRNGKGESVWTTMALKYGINQILTFCKKKNDHQQVEKLESIRDSLDNALNEHAWDGKWYIAAYDDGGSAMGSNKDREGKIFLNTQSWAIISHTARGRRLENCLESIEKLETPFGPRLLDPPLSKWDKRWGKISVKLPGTAENGSVYCHASMFKAYADCMVGAGDKAYETIRKTLPTNPDNSPENNLQVPIFIPNYYYGLKDKPSYGHSSQHNFTGTVSWMLWVTIEYILGVRATIDGLVIEPNLPQSWNDVFIKRKYKEASYSIKILNITKEKSDVKKIVVNGEVIKGNILPYANKKLYQVIVEI